MKNTPIGGEKNFQQQHSMSSHQPLPSNFPELVGLPGEDAKRKLRKLYPSTASLSTIEVIPENSFVTCDYRQDRVRIFVDEKNGKVVNVPKIG
mmetsp:Transcript_3953/g.10353  ORF Transcript_3953/g.10353 Transcript_3953/m.10353 type:complete len:93 (-) Transcript_3953:154-432(-)